MAHERAELSPVLGEDIEILGPSWEEIARPGFAGAFLEYQLRIRFRRDVDWSKAILPVAELYESKDGFFERGGRTITLQPRQLTLGVAGTKSEPPAPDDKLQTRLIALVLQQLRDHLKNVGTERWTDTPFEEPPEKTRRRSVAIDFLEQLVLNTVTIRIAELDYYRPRLMGGDAANPEIQLQLTGPVERTFAARLNWMPVTTFVPPGRYQLTASAPAFGLPEYRGALKQYAQAPIFVAPPLLLSGAAGDTFELRLGVPEAKRRLPPAHKAFYEQWNADRQDPPPPPLPDLVLELLEPGSIVPDQGASQPAGNRP